MAGGILAAVATQVQAVAVGWELYERTRSAADLGLVGLVQFLPVLFLSLPAGQAADHFSRKGMLIAAQALMALASLGLAILSFIEGPIFLIYLCLLLVGVARAFSAPARWAILPQVVPLELLNNAVTWNSSGWHIAFVVGPALGGLVIAAVHPAAAYVVTVGCVLAGIVLLASIHPRREERAVEVPSLKSLLAGIRFVWQTKVILATITLDLFAVLLGGATALLPIFARDILEVGPSGLGLLRAAPAMGALAMALTMAHRPPLRRAGKSLLIAVAGFGAATIVFGLSQDFLLSLAALALTGALDNISVVIRGTLVQVLTPDAMRGRVSAVNAIFIGSSNELGAFESGITAEWWGAVPSVIVGGSGTLVVVLTVMLLWPELIRLGPLHGMEQKDIEDAAKASAEEEALK